MNNFKIGDRVKYHGDNQILDGVVVDLAPKLIRIDFGRQVNIKPVHARKFWVKPSSVEFNNED